MKDIVLHKRNIIIVALVLLFINPVTYAMYRRTMLGTAGVASADWNVSLSQNNVNNILAVLPDPNGTSASYTVNINTNSEVDIIYSIVIDNLPTGTSVSLDGGSYVSESNHKVTLNNAGTILYSDVSKNRTHTLTFKAGSGTSYVNNQEIDIDVIIKQQL